jgi:hypothetical protein
MVCNDIMGERIGVEIILLKTMFGEGNKKKKRPQDKFTIIIHDDISFECTKVEYMSSINMRLRDKRRGELTWLPAVARLQWLSLIICKTPPVCLCVNVFYSFSKPSSSTLEVGRILLLRFFQG